MSVISPPAMMVGSSVRWDFMPQWLFTVVSFDGSQALIRRSGQSADSTHLVARCDLSVSNHS